MGRRIVCNMVGYGWLGVLALERVVDRGGVLISRTLPSRRTNFKPFALGSVADPDNGGPTAVRVVERTIGNDRSEINDLGDVITMLVADVDPVPNTKAFVALDIESARTAFSVMFESGVEYTCLLYTSPSPRDKRQSRMPSSA